jgi:putative ABC transport system permease protein
MNVSTRKAVRDLRRQRTQVLAVAITVMLGVGLYIASAGAFQNLSGSYQQTYDRLHFADLVATGGDTEQVAAAATAAGASAVTVRTQVDPPMLIEDTKLIGRVIGLPADSRPDVGDVEVTSGQYLSPGDPAGVLVETHAADTFGISPGDSLQVFTPQGWQRLTVRGIAVSPEYLWPARSRQDVLGDPHSFAVVFAPEESLRSWSGGANQVLAEAPPGPLASGSGPVAIAMREAGAVDVTPQSELPSPAALQLDLDGFNEMSVAFPLLFLTAAAMAAHVLLSRRVRAERPIIGTLMASGAHRGRLVRHYLLQGLLIGLLGSILGIALGVGITGPLTSAYTGELGIPDTVVSQHPELSLVGLLVGVLVGGLGAAGPAWTAARTGPADAMRNETTSASPGRWSRAVSRFSGLPVAGRMALRDVFRSPRRTGATALGAVLALVLILASLGLMTSMISALRIQYDEVELQDATVAVDAAAAEEVASSLRALSDVTAVEPSQAGAVTVSAGSKSYATSLQGFEPDTQMHGFRATGGESIALPPDGVLAGAELTTTLGVAVGDTVTVTDSAGKSSSVRIAGFLDEPLGTSLYATNAVAGPLLTGVGAETLLVRFASGADRNTMRQTISTMDGVVAYSDKDALVTSLDQYLGLFWVFVAVMVGLGALLALAIIYVTMAVTVVERTNELATLRAAGVPLRRVGATLATENLVATMLGLPLGLALGVVAAWQFLVLFSSDMFQLSMTLPWWSLAAAAGGVLLAAALSQWPAVRAVRRLDIAKVVRERAG